MMKSFCNLLLIAVVLTCVGANTAWAEFIDVDSTVAVGVRLKFPIKADGTSADADSAWLIVNRWGGTIDTAHYFRAWVNTTDIDTSSGIAKASWRGTPTSLQRRYHLMVKAGEMLQIDASATPDTAYQGRYSGTFNAFAGGYATETMFDFMWFRGGTPKTWPQTIATVTTVTDSVIVDGSSLSGTTNAISSTTLATNSITTNELQNGTITAAKFGNSAITSSVMAAGAIGVGVIEGGALIELADTVWLSRVSRFRQDDRYTNPAFKDSVFAAAFSVGVGSALKTGVRVNFDSSAGTIANSQVDDDVDVNANVTGWVGVATDPTNVALSSVPALASFIADSVWEERISTHRVDSSFGGAYGYIPGGTRAVVIVDFDSAQGTLADDQADVITVNIKDPDTVAVASSAAATISTATMGNISDSVWAKDTSNTLWNGLLNKFGEWNASAQALTGSNCGSGAQALTIYVLDTSGTDELVTAFVTIYNSAQTSILAYGTALGGITGTFGVSASTAHKGLALASGYYFPLYSFTTGSGASHTDTIRGYDVPTSAGSSVPSGQQVQLYDWAITHANDTLYGAQVDITLVGSTDFYTSTVVVPPSTLVRYAGVNDGTANGGKWQATVFGTDSLFAPGADNATYSITIRHKSLKVPITYEGLKVPAGSTIRLRQILDDQD